MNTFDWMDDHEEPPYVFAATGPFSSSYRRTESTGNLYLSSSILFFSNGILDPGYLPTSLSIAYTLFHVLAAYF